MNFCLTIMSFDRQCMTPTCKLWPRGTQHAISRLFDSRHDINTQSSKNFWKQTQFRHTNFGFLKSDTVSICAIYIDKYCSSIGLRYESNMDITFIKCLCFIGLYNGVIKLCLKQAVLDVLRTGYSISQTWNRTHGPTTCVDKDLGPRRLIHRSGLMLACVTTPSFIILWGLGTFNLWIIIFWTSHAWSTLLWSSEGF